MTSRTIKKLEKENAELRDQLKTAEMNLFQSFDYGRMMKARIEKARNDVIKLRQNLTFIGLGIRLFKQLDNRLITHQEILEGKKPSSDEEALPRTLIPRKRRSGRRLVSHVQGGLSEVNRPVKCPRCGKDELHVDTSGVHATYCGYCGYVEGLD